MYLLGVVVVVVVIIIIEMRSPSVSQCISGLLMCKSWQCWLPTIFRLVMLLQISLVCRTLGSNQDQWCDRGNFVKPPCQQQKLQIWPECISKRYASYWNVCWPSFLRNMYCTCGLGLRPDSILKQYLNMSKSHMLFRPPFINGRPQDSV